jgi:hypothetical protein
VHNGPVTTESATANRAVDATSDPLGTEPLQLCSEAARRSEDDPAGSAANFSSFLLLDHREHWSTNAADDAVGRLRPELAAAVRARPGLRAFAIRSVHRRSGTNFPAALGGPAGPDGRIVRWSHGLDKADLDRLESGERESADTEPIFAVCTNGRRDRCCAIVGRGVAVGLHERFGDRVVEISHLGGHRYAGTMLVLPWGYAYGFLDLMSAAAVAQAAMDGLVLPGNLRGRADLAPVAQAADVLLRRRLGPAAPEAVRIDEVRQEAGAPTSHRVKAEVAGQQVDALLHRAPGPPVTLTQCGGKPFETGRWTLQIL